MDGLAKQQNEIFVSARLPVCLCVFSNISEVSEVSKVSEVSEVSEVSLSPKDP